MAHLTGLSWRLSSHRPGVSRCVVLRFTFCSRQSDLAAGTVCAVPGQAASSRMPTFETAMRKRPRLEAAKTDTHIGL